MRWTFLARLSAHVVSGGAASVHEGLLNVPVRMRVGYRTDKRIRSPVGSRIMAEMQAGLLVSAP
jgi:hypothetical protein